MKKGKAKGLNISNKLHYTIVALVAIILIAVGVYAATSYPASGAGHNLNELATGSCSNDQIIKMVEGVWTCAADATGSGGTSGIASPNPCPDFSVLTWNAPNGVWECLPATDSRFWIKGDGSLCYNKPTACTAPLKTCSVDYYVNVPSGGNCPPTNICTNYCVSPDSSCIGDTTSLCGTGTNVSTTATQDCSTVSSGYVTCHCTASGTYYKEEYAPERCL